MLMESLSVYKACVIYIMPCLWCMGISTKAYHPKVGSVTQASGELMLLFLIGIYEISICLNKLKMQIYDEILKT